MKKTEMILKGSKALFLIFLASGSWFANAQTCTSSPTTVSSNTNMSSLTWTASGGATVAQCNAMATGTAFTGNVVIDIANNTTVTVTNNLSLTGNFVLTGGPGSTLSVTGGHTVHVFGGSHYMGDPTNNGVQYNVASSTDKIIVDGTLYGKNNNAFTGSGSISGGTLDVKNGSTCGSPCPVTGGFSNCTSGDAFCSNYGALPITLISFDAVLNNDVVSINWATSMQEDFDKFVIERSVDKQSFESIGEVTGEGKNVHMENDYSFSDYNPQLGSNYYRLKAVDLDGSFEYFKVVMVDFSGNRKLWINPNPSKGSLVKFSVNFEPSGFDKIIVINNVGRQVLNGSASELKGQLAFDSPLSPGVYIMKYVSSHGELVSRLLVD